MAALDESTTAAKKEIIVLGAGELSLCGVEHHLTSIGFPTQLFPMGIGVVGLTTALKLQQQGTYQVTIVSEVTPSDPKSIRYTSRWAVRPAALSERISVYYKAETSGVSVRAHTTFIIPSMKQISTVSTLLGC